MPLTPQDVEALTPLDDAETTEAMLRAALSSASATEAALRAEVERLTREREAVDAVLREACAGSEPSAGHTLAEEVAGLLRVTRGQRDAEAHNARVLAEQRLSYITDLRAAESREAALRGERDEACEALERCVSVMEVHLPDCFGECRGDPDPCTICRARAVLARIRKEPDHE